MENFQVIFGPLPDPRDANSWHELPEIMFIALAAMLCGAQSCVDMQEFGEAKEPLLRQFLTLKHGVPSHDTFSRVFRVLDPEALEACFSRFVAAFGAALGQVVPGSVVAIDGKSLRRAYEKGRAYMPPLMVSAFAAGTRITLAQTLAPNGNEVAGALRLFELITLKGCIVTGDALHCNRGMAEAVLDAKADYVLTLKANQSALASDAAAILEAIGPTYPVAETTEQAHDREERRRAVVVAARQLAKKHDFPGLTAIGRIEAWRTINGVTSEQVRYFVLSKRLTPSQLLTTVREHWAIENAAHWPLDVVFHEDLARNRKDNGPRNLAVTRRMTLNILRAHPSKSSLAVKRKWAGWNDDFFVSVWTHMR
jgi:predicted transposase YbfD/YdcC